jgi:hypothetical protein
MPRLKELFSTSLLITTRENNQNEKFIKLPSLRKFPPGQLRTFLAEVVIPRSVNPVPSMGVETQNISKNDIVKSETEKLELSSPLGNSSVILPVFVEHKKSYFSLFYGYSSLVALALAVAFGVILGQKVFGEILIKLGIILS